ncbi:hypothetical protein L6Q96_01835 [Candidatus Binatia bacterium]|nr:hypothetical protein [Candidatus Binatia bacterium]
MAKTYTQPTPKHGSRTLNRLYRERKLDGRTELSRDINAIQDALAAERGGWERCSAAEKVLFEPLAFAAVWLRLMNRYVAEHGGLLDPTGEPIGAAKLYFVNFNSLVRACTALGLRPPEPAPALTLGEYLQARAQAATEPAGGTIESPTDSLPAPDRADPPEAA